MRRDGFTEQFDAAVEVLGVGYILLGVHAGASREYAIGADMDQPGAGIATEPGDPMWGRGVDLDIGQCIVGVRTLLDQTDAVDDGLRSELVESGRETCR